MLEDVQRRQELLRDDYAPFDLRRRGSRLSRLELKQLGLISATSSDV